MEPYRPKFGLHAWRELAGYSLWMWLSSLVYIVWLRADPLVVGSQVSKASLGLYVVALDIALLPATEIMEPIGAVLFASFAAESNAGRDPRGNSFSLAVSLMMVMAPIAVVISAALSDIVGVLLGSNWSAAAPIVAILAFAVVLSPFSNTAAQSLTASGKVRANLAVVVSASVIKVAVLYTAASTGDLYVIASALIITSFEASMFIYVLHRNGSRLGGMGWPIVRSSVALGLAALAFKSTGIAWAGDQVFPLVTCLLRGAILGIVGGGVYTAALGGLWLLAGRPESPERQIAVVTIPLVSQIAHRLGAIFARKRPDPA